VARFLERLGISVVILGEMPSKGRTIIEKIEAFAEIGYAIVLLTSDDTMSYPGTERRARQNVIFELGFFIAKLGRSRVSVLLQEGIEIPSDISGVLYIAIDPAGSWKIKLARELSIAGIPLDFNKAI
jgi:predicted nucleotide-binding protein